MSAAIQRFTFGAGYTAVTVVVAKDAAGALTLRIEDWFGAHDTGASAADLLALAAAIVTVVNA